MAQARKDESKVDMKAPDGGVASKDTNMEIPVGVGQKRTYIDATGQMLEESKTGASGGGLRGLQDIIHGLESQKKRQRVE